MGLPLRRAFTAHPIVTRASLVSAAALLVVGATATMVASADPPEDPTFGANGHVFLDPAGHSHGSEDFSVAAPAADGGVYAVTYGRIMKFGADGELDLSFGDAGVVELPQFVLAIAVSPDGSRLAAINAAQNAQVWSLTSDGAIVDSFGDGGVADIPFTATSLRFDSAGRILVGGFHSVMFEPRNVMVERLTTAGVPDSSFSGDGVVDTGRVSYMLDAYRVTALPLDGGKTVVVSRGSSSSGLQLTRLTASGDPDSGFGIGGSVALTDLFTGTGEVIGSIDLDPSGRVVVAGIHTSASTATGRVVRIETDGSLDGGFDGDGIVDLSGVDLARAAAAPDGGVIVVQGDETRRLGENGATDSGFGSGGVTELGSSAVPFGTTAALVVDASGAITVAGGTPNGSVPPSGFLGRLEADGDPDPGFGAGGWRMLRTPSRSADVATDLVVTEDGPVSLVSTNADDAGPRLVALDHEGDLDHGFGVGGVTLLPGVVRADALAGRPDGSLIVAGVDGSGRPVVVRVTAAGIIDSSFGAGGTFTWTSAPATTSPIDVDVRTDGSVDIALAVNSGGSHFLHVLRLSSAGVLQSAFGAAGVATFDTGGTPVSSPTLRSLTSGAVVVAANHGAGGSSDENILVVRLLANGTPDPAFGATGMALIDVGGIHSDQLTAMTIDGEGRVVVAGKVDNSNPLLLARLTSTGLPDEGFGVGGIVTPNFGSTFPTLRNVSLLADGRLALAGNAYGGVTNRAFVALFHDDGTLATEFAGTGYTVNLPNGRSGAYVNAAAADAAGHLLIAGSADADAMVMRIDPSWDGTTPTTTTTTPPTTTPPTTAAPPTSTPTTTTPPTPDASPVQLLDVPDRLLDSRRGGTTVDGLDAGTGRVPAGGVIEVKVAGRHGLPADARTVVLNVTAVVPSADGYLTVYPCGQTAPTTSNVNFRAGSVIANSVVTGVGAAGKVCILSSVETNVLADVSAYVADPDALVALQRPGRLLDSRPGGITVDGRGVNTGRLPAGAGQTVQVTGRAAVPADARTVVLNVTAVEPSDDGYLAVYPCGRPAPATSNVNFAAGSVVANSVVTAVGDGGTICITGSAATHVLVDVFAYSRSDTIITPLTEAKRLYDSRHGASTTDGQQAGGGRIRANDVVRVHVAGRGGVPTGARSTVLNLTAVQPSGGGYLAAFPCGEGVPNVSSVNFAGGDVVANSAIVRIGDAGDVCLLSSVATDVIVDVNGYI